MEFLDVGSISACSRMPAPGLVVCSFHGPLCYASAETFLCEVLSQINLLSINKGTPAAPRWLKAYKALNDRVQHLVPYPS
jgi:hypothetical protein